jgi:hypothetical protein
MVPVAEVEVNTTDTSAVWPGLTAAPIVVAFPPRLSPEIKTSLYVGNSPGLGKGLPSRNYSSIGNGYIAYVNGIVTSRCDGPSWRFYGWQHNRGLLLRRSGE